MKGRSPGGSSGGEGALHARRGVPFGVGTDMGGVFHIAAAPTPTGALAAVRLRRPALLLDATSFPGSLRIPAAFCGTMGFKPTKLRVGLRDSHIALPGQSAIASTVRAAQAAALLSPRPPSPLTRFPSPLHLQAGTHGQ